MAKLIETRASYTKMLSNNSSFRCEVTSTSVELKNSFTKIGELEGQVERLQKEVEEYKDKLNTQEKR